MPGRPRLPQAKAELVGAIAKDPQRFRDRSNPESQGPVGAAPDFLNEGEVSAWNSFVLEWSWLTYEDRAALTSLSQMRAMLEDNDQVKNTAFYAAYRLMLSEHGGTPVSRSKIYQPGSDEDEEDAFAKFGKAN